MGPHVTDELRGAIVVARHGHSIMNGERKDTGRIDPSLSIRGAYQGLQLGARIGLLDADVWYASRLRRQWLTAAIASGAVKLEPVPTRKQASDSKQLTTAYRGTVTVDPEGPIVNTTLHLMERSYGDWEGEKKNPEQKKALGYFKAPPRGMSLEELEVDVYAVLDLCARRHRDEVIVAITSNGWLRAAIGIQLDSAREKDDLVNVSFPHSIPFTLHGLVRFHHDLGTKTGPNLTDPLAYLVVPSRDL